MSDLTATQLDAGPGYTYTYIVADETWWWSARRLVDPRPTLMIAKSADNGGCAWEFAMVHQELAITNETAIQLRMHDDAFAAFVEIAPFFSALATQKPTTLDGVRLILDALGVVDATERKDPNQ